MSQTEHHLSSPRSLPSSSSSFRFIRQENSTSSRKDGRGCDSKRIEELESKLRLEEGSNRELRTQNDGLLKHYLEAAEYKGKLTNALKQIQALETEKFNLAKKMEEMKVLHTSVMDQLKRSQTPGLPPQSPLPSALHKDAREEKEKIMKKMQKPRKYTMASYKAQTARKKMVKTSPSMTRNL